MQIIGDWLRHVTRISYLCISNKTATQQRAVGKIAFTERQFRHRRDVLQRMEKNLFSPAEDSYANGEP